MKILKLCRLSLFILLLIAGPSATRAATTNFFEGFESGLTNWVVGDGNPTGPPAYWGAVNAAFGGEGAHGGSAKAYCAAVGFAGSTASPNYTNDMTAYLSRTISLAGYTNATLSFWSKIPGLEATFDFARVLIGSTEIWATDQPQLNWTPVSLSLESFLGATQTLTFQFSTDVSVTREGWYLDDITIPDANTPAPPPTNDNFSAAQIIAGALGSVGATTRGATAESLEPDPGNSIWFRWTPYTNGLVTFRTGGSAFDTLLCVYRGSTLANLVRLACDDNGDSNNASLVSFNAVVGTNYLLSVRGVGDAAGFALLSWLQTNGIGAELRPDLSVLADDANDYLYGWYLDQAEATQPGRTLMRVSTATPNTGTGPLELRGSSTAPGVSQRVFRADGSSYDRFAGNFTFHPGHGHLHFDNWINLHLRAVLTNDAVGGIVASGDKTSFAIIDLTHNAPSLPGSPSSSVYGGGLIQGLSVGWADIYGASLQDQWIDVTDVPSGRYWLEAIVDPANSILESNETNNAARILITYVAPAPPNNQPPPNDHFTNAIVLAGPTGGDTGDNEISTREPGEPLHLPGNTSSRSVWWRWTAPSNMTATISTDGSSFDTVLAVYTGGGVAGLSLVASDDDAGLGNKSLVTFPATAGVTYRLAVDGYSGATGGIQLNLNPAFNDAFANCLVITGRAGRVSGSTRGATRQSGEPNHAAVGSAGSIWFCWTAPTNGPFTFDTSGSSFDTVLGIYTGAAVNALTAIASDNDSAGNFAARVTFNAVSNTLYRIAVAGPPGATGVVKLAWSGPLPPSVVTPPGSTNAPAGGVVTFRVAATGSPTLAYQWRHQGTNLLDGDYVSGANTATLRLGKIQFAHAGQFTVVITNAYGSVTSAPGNLIVLDNPRVVFIDPVCGPSGAFVRVPVNLQSLGNENAVGFSLLFDPAVLSRPRATNLPAGATLALNTNQLASGALGVSLTLPGLATFASGDAALGEFIFDTAPSSGTVNTFAGFGGAPWPRLVSGTNGDALAALFAAGTVKLEPFRMTGGARSNGVYRFTFAAGAGNTFVVDASEDLIVWTPMLTNVGGVNPFQFSETNALPYRFYRVRLVP